MLQQIFALWALFSSTSTPSPWNVSPFKINLSESVQRMNSLVESYRLPAHAIYPGLGFRYGIDLDWFKALQKTWAHDFDWDKTQARMNRFSHHKVTIENVTIHFIHQRSSDKSAIPIIMSHGWPGSFYEFDRIIEPLSNPPKGSGRQAFHVVVPSLPGFGFSSPPPSFSWNNNDTARVFATLMTEVLGYEFFGAVGSDIGSSITWELLNNHAEECKAVLMTHLATLPVTLTQYEAIWPDEAAQLTASDLDGIARSEAWLSDGFAYFMEHATKPSTIGLALYDNPMGQLAWIGQLMHDWSDPNSNPNGLSDYTILEQVSLYFLTNTIETAGYVYAQNPEEFAQLPTLVRSPVGISEFKYDIVHLPTFRTRQLANITYHVKHDVGGHFPALENPDALVADIRAFFHANWVGTV